MTLSDPACMEILSQAGFDFLLIDMQEAPIGFGALRDLLIAGKGTGTALVVRVAWNDPVQVKQVLDLGADGVMVPMINSAEEARRALAACKYPPEGIRSVGAWRASNYYQNEPDYLQRSNVDLVVIVQIEHARALAALDEILAVPGIDAVFIGPSDLAASLNHLGDPAHCEVQAAFGRIAEACRVAGVPFGTDLGDIGQQAALGMRFFLAGMDITFLGAGARTSVQAARGAFGRPFN